MQQLLDNYLIPEPDFNRVVRNTRLTEKSLLIAREILVEGKDLTAVAARTSSPGNA